MKRYTSLCSYLILFTIFPLQAFEPVSMTLISGAFFVIGYGVKALRGADEKPVEVLTGTSHLVKSERERNRNTLNTNRPLYLENILSVEENPAQVVQESLDRLSEQEKKLRKIEKQEPGFAGRVEQEVKALKELYRELEYVRNFLGSHKKEIELFLLRKRLKNEYPTDLRSLYVSSSSALRLARTESARTYPLTHYHEKLSTLIKDTSQACRLADECRDYSIKSEMHERCAKLQLLQDALVSTDQYQQEVQEKRHDALREKREQMQAMIKAMELKLHSEQARSTSLHSENRRLRSDLKTSHDRLQRTERRCDSLCSRVKQLQENQKILQQQLDKWRSKDSRNLNPAPEGQPPYEAKEHTDWYGCPKPSAPPESAV